MNRRDWVIVVAVIIGVTCLGCTFFTAIMGAILFPVFQQAREKARQTVCISNEKILALALTQYILDYDETLPPASQWTEVTYPYFRDESILVCPKAPSLSCGYAFYQPLSVKKLKQISKPAETLMLYDSSLGHWNVTDEGQSLDARHFNGANIGFVDGHVKWYRLEYARPLFCSPP